MKKPFFFGLLLVLIFGVTFLMVRTCFLPQLTPSLSPPSLGPSLMSPVADAAVKGIGDEDRFVAFAAIEQAVASGASVVKPLEELCRNGTDLQKRDALVALMRIDPSLASDIALSLYASQSVELLRTALTVSAKSNDIRAANQIKELVTNADELVRARAGEASVFVIPNEALAILRSLLDDKSAYVRQVAYRAFVAFTYFDAAYSHSDFDSERAQVLAGIDGWVAENSSKPRFEWLQNAALSAINGLTSDDVVVRYDSAMFLKTLLGENNYNWYDSPQQLELAARELRKRWTDFVPLFEKNPPINLNLELQ